MTKYFPIRPYQQVRLQQVRRPLAAGLALLGTLAFAPAAAAGTPEADANVKLVQSFLADVRVAAFQHKDAKEIREVVERYMRPDYIQHSEDVAPGREGYIEGMAKMATRPPASAAPASQPPAAQPQQMPKMEDLYWIADGDKVVWVSSVQRPDQPKPEFMFNMMRIQDHKIAEHWGK